MWRCEYYATLTLWRISCECKTFTFAAYSPEMIRLPRRITEKVRPFKWLRMLPNFLRIPANFIRSLRSVCRISCESFANVNTTYECLKPGVHTNDFAPIHRLRALKLGHASLATVFRPGRLTLQPILRENLESPVLR